jgi:hypothetical protein
MTKQSEEDDTHRPEETKPSTANDTLGVVLTPLQREDLEAIGVAVAAMDEALEKVNSLECSTESFIEGALALFAKYRAAVAAFRASCTELQDHLLSTETRYSPATMLQEQIWDIAAEIWLMDESLAELFPSWTGSPNTLDPVDRCLKIGGYLPGGIFHTLFTRA